MKFDPVNNETTDQALTDDELLNALATSNEKTEIDVLANEEREQSKCDRLLRFIHSHQPMSKASSPEQMSNALELSKLLVNWIDKQSASYEEIVAKHYVLSVLTKSGCPIRRVSDRIVKSPDSKKPNHRPRLPYEVLCQTYVFVKDNDISAAAKHFGIAPKTVRDRLNSLTAEVNRIFKKLLKEQLGSYKDLLQLEDEMDDISITKLLRSGAGIS